MSCKRQIYKKFKKRLNKLGHFIEWTKFELSSETTWKTKRQLFLDNTFQLRFVSRKIVSSKFSRGYDNGKIVCSKFTQYDPSTYDLRILKNSAWIFQICGS